MMHVTKPQPKSEPIPWRWFADGKWKQLRQYEDFQQTPQQAANAGRTWAHRHHYHCRYAILDDCLYIKLTPPPQPEV